MQSIKNLVASLHPEKTVLFFGSGASLPSGAPSAAALTTAISQRFGAPTGFNLADASMLAEIKADRSELIKFLRTQFRNPAPTGGLKNVSLYDWKSIFTTNYDELVEHVYRQNQKDLVVYSSNFDFSQDTNPLSAKLFKIHGTIDKDVSDGDHSRIVLTSGDYDKTLEYREFLYDRLSADMAGAQTIFIGHSLADPDIKEVLDRIILAQSKLHGSGGKISLLFYERDEDRAALYEARGIQIAFGSIDDFFAELAKQKSGETPDSETAENILDLYPRLRAITTNCAHAAESFQPNFNRMFNGAPATYADVRDGLTFVRETTKKICATFASGSSNVLTLLGASGVGKTTCARQVALAMLRENWEVWEHQSDFDLDPQEWVLVAQNLTTLDQNGLLIVDEGHFQVEKLNELASALEARENTQLKLLIISSKHQWLPRFKAPAISSAKIFEMSKLVQSEIDALLGLVEQNETIRPLVEANFGEYSRQERRRRLMDRCGADMFVCLKNIFATERFDTIILQEFAELKEDYQLLYKLVSAMEYSGIRVHRQLVVRMLGIPSDQIATILDLLDEIILEYDVQPREQIYGWRVRHPVIAGIIVRYKFSDTSAIGKMFDDVIGAISPTYEIERRTIREICNVETGIPSIPDKRHQNKLLRKMISIAPGERVPRHRLIRNLIDLEEFDQAEAEIRLFKNDLNQDGPLARYRINLKVARARSTPGLLTEDRRVMLQQAEKLAVSFVERYNHNRSVHSAYCEVGLEVFKLTGEAFVFDDALDRFKEAEAKFADPEMTKAIARYERRFRGQEVTDLTSELDEDEA